MKTIEVVAAIICDSNRVFATQRGYGEFEGWWEFPGGKIEQGESHHEALKREIREELAVEIEVGERLCTVEYDYPMFHLTMHCYMASQLDGDIALLEHKAARWLTKSELDEVEWLPADVSVVDSLRSID
ncbi:MAG: 8-oxo-dGTP diphosphatase MutT [Paludibacteraceae bacterium]|nr:8-oxo-dGTP diphosphatase MutT [Paludibacteraceae bacterium]